MVKPGLEPTPAHVASHEVYLAGLDSQYMGADFSQDMSGTFRLNAATILARHIEHFGHTDLEAAQVVRNICNYTARRIELGMATTTGMPFVMGDGHEAGSTHTLATDDLESLGVSQGQSWIDIRQHVAGWLARDLEDYRDTLVDSRQSRKEVANIDKWLPVVGVIADELNQEIVVTSGPRLLPGVEVVALQDPKD